MSSRKAYPLSWPEGWPRTPSHRRQRGRFEVSLSTAYGELLGELRRLGARSVVVSTAIPTRRDGMPYANRSWSRGDDPGVAVYFDLAGKPKAIPCDAYDTPAANIRAIGLSVAAMRALDRYGVAGLLERTFAGLDALPAPDHFDWREALGYAADARPTRDEVLARFRTRAFEAHPDRGGDDKTMARLTRARDEAIKELTP